MKGPGGMDFTRMMKEAQSQLKEFQKRMAALDETLKERVVEGSAGGGVVKVLFNANIEALDVKIDPAVLKEQDPELLGEMVLAAVRQGLKKAQDVAEEEKKKLAGGMALPGMENLL